MHTLTNMKLKKFTFRFSVIAALLYASSSVASCGFGNASASQQQNSDHENVERKGPKVGGPQLGAPGGGPAIDKTGDETLQAMIKSIVPEFKQFVFTDPETGKTIKYNLYKPADVSTATRYPLVLFMADASTPGDDFSRPLTQGYGALVWATEQWQKQNPCYVLVPQFSGVAVNDAYEHTDEVDMVIRLLRTVVAENNVDPNRLYTTGQSMGGMISMYYNITYPDIFAASVFVDCHWDTNKFEELARHKFTFITAGKSGSSFGNIQALEDAADKDGVRYEYESWSAKLPQAEQDSLASVMLAKGAPVNIINFTPKSVLPEDGKGSEHMYSFDYAYKLTPVREWLFKQSK